MLETDGIQQKKVIRNSTRLVEYGARCGGLVLLVGFAPADELVVPAFGFASEMKTQVTEMLQNINIPRLN